MKQYILFDLDGTLTDPKLGITRCVQHALKAFQIEEPDLDKLEAFIGPPLLDSFVEFYHMNHQQAAEAIKIYRERFSTVGLYENEIYRGIPRLLKGLKRKGLRLAIASSKPTVFVERILQHFKIASYFDVIVGSELDGRRTEKSEVVQEALRQLFELPEELAVSKELLLENIPKDQIYMIGDRKFDVQGAKAFGIECVGVSYGYGGIEELMEAKADYIVRSVPELQEFLLRGYEDPKCAVTALDKTKGIFLPLFYFLATKYVVEGIALAILGPIRTPAMDAVVTGASYLMAMLMILGLFLSSYREYLKWERLRRLYYQPVTDKLLYGLGAVGAGICINGVMALSGILELPSYQRIVESQMQPSLGWMLVVYGIISAAAEELLFRGILYVRYRQYFGVKFAALMSAFLFGVYHMNLVQGIYGFLMGLILAGAMVLFGDIKITIGIHVVLNCIACIIQKHEGVGNYIFSTPGIAVSFVLAVVIFLFLYKKRKMMQRF